jgi:nitroreductase
MRNEIAVTNAVIECILSRSAVKNYDSSAILSDDLIRDLVRIGTTAPTSFHLQNWRFIAVRSPEAKARLRPIAFDQPMITEAAVTFIVCGRLVETSVIPERVAPVVAAGVMPPGMASEWEMLARDLYMAYPQRRREHHNLA